MPAYINTGMAGFEPYASLIEEHKVSECDTVSRPVTSYYVF
jgi:hypothetical protein